MIPIENTKAMYSDTYLPITNIQASVVLKNTEEKVFADMLLR